MTFVHVHPGVEELGRVYHAHLAINATPIGMKDGDPHPIDSTKFTAQQFVGCVITAPAVPPIVSAARAKGCNTLTGADMFARVRDLMVQFLLEV